MPLTADLHFLRSDPPDLIARKMLRQNLSDLAGKGAKPLGYLMTTALDDGIDEAWIAKFADGLAQDQARVRHRAAGAATPPRRRGRWR